MGFTHKKITPRHPKAQGQVEGFNKLMNKTAAIARTEGVDLQEATYDMLQECRETPHPATGTAPYELLVNKTAAIARTEGVDLQEATYDMLQACRQMPHPATGTAPYELLVNREIHTRPLPNREI